MIDYTSNLALPNQRVSFSAKQKRDWFVPTANFKINECLSNSTDKQLIQAEYNAVNGIILESDYTYVTNPFHSQNEKLKQFPAKMRNHDIITPIVMRYVGEYIKQKYKPIVGINNADVPVQRRKQEFEQVKPIIDKLFAETLVAKGGGGMLPDGGQGVQQEQQQQQQQPKPQPTYAERITRITANWADFRVKQGQQALSLLTDKLELNDKYWGAFLDWITTGQYYSYKDVYRDDVRFEVIHPSEAYPLNNGETWVEDMSAFLRVYEANIFDIYTNERDELDEKDKLYLEERINQFNSGSSKIQLNEAFYSNRFGDVYEDISKFKMGTSSNFCKNDGTIKVYHQVWKSLRKIGVLEYMDNLGVIHQKEVSDKYKLKKEFGDVRITYEYVPEVLEIKRYGDEHTGVWTKPKRVTVQRNEINNTAAVKLPYGGRCVLLPGLINHSVVKILLPYQVIYNIIHYYREMAIANNVGKILVLPKGILVNDDEITQEETIGYIKSDKKLYVDETADGFPNAIQALKSIDASDAQYITGLSQILVEIKEEAWDSVGMNRQRYGDTYASDGKATTEQAIFRASIGSAPIVEVFNLSRSKDNLSLLDFTKYAWASDDEIKPLGSYISEDGRVEFLTITPRSYIESDFGVYVKNATEEQDRIQAYKELSFSASQNGAFELAVASIEAESPAQLKSAITAWRELEDDRQKAQAQQAQQAQQQALQAQSELQAKVFEHELLKTNIQSETQIETALIKADSVDNQTSNKRDSDSEKHDALRDESRIKADTEKYKAEAEKYKAHVMARAKNTK